MASTNEDTPRKFDWHRDHPVLNQMKEWSFEDVHRVHAAFAVYLDLCEAKTWWNVSVHPCQELQMAYITGKPEKKAEYMTVLPVCAQENLGVRRMEQFLEHIPPILQKDSEVTTLQDGSSSSPTNADHVITLALVAADSTIVYYNISNGLQQPKNVLETEDDSEEGKSPNRKRKQGQNKRWRGKYKKP